MSSPPAGFTVLRAGDWAPGDIAIEWVPSGRRIVPEVEAAVERAWADALARPGAHLFDGPMCRLERWAVSDDPARLRLQLSPTSYKPFLGTNMTRPELADRYGEEVLASPVGVSPALETADGFLLLGRRNAAVAYYPNRVHPFAGALEPGDRDVFAAVRRELREELSLAEAEVPELGCTGLVREAALRQTELIFRARCTLSREQIERRLDPEEHRSILAVLATRAGVESILSDPAVTPVGAAALLLWGRARFGDEWFASRAPTESSALPRRGV